MTYTPGPTIEHIGDLGQEVERLRALLDFGTSTDAYRTLRRRNQELMVENQRLRAQHKELLRSFAKALDLLEECNEPVDTEATTVSNYQKVAAFLRVYRPLLAATKDPGP